MFFLVVLRIIWRMIQNAKKNKARVFTALIENLMFKTKKGEKLESKMWESKMCGSSHLDDKGRSILT